MGQQKMKAITAIEQADQLLQSMKGQMLILREYAERNGGPPEFNDSLHTAVMMGTMVDAVRAVLDDAAQIIMGEPSAPQP